MTALSSGGLWENFFCTRFVEKRKVLH